MHEWQLYSLDKGAFNNYVDKKRGRGGQPKVHACPLRGRVVNLITDNSCNPIFEKMISKW